METHQVKNLDKGHIAVFGDVDDEKVQAVIEQLLYLENRRSVREVTIWVNSAGGLLQPAFGLSDVMLVLEKPIRTIGLGTVESAATVLLTSGTPGRRLVTPNASLMIHEYSWSNSGSVTEMRGRMTDATEMYVAMGLDVGQCKAWTEKSEITALYRQLLFQRIVPIVKDIGLWGDKVQDAYRDMGVLHFQDLDPEELQKDDEAKAKDFDARSAYVQAVAGAAAE